jgi:hypothetical protein
MTLPNQDNFGELGEFEKQMQASHWALLFLISETTAGFHILMDKMVEKGVMDEDDAKSMDEALLNIEYMKSNYMHIQKAFLEKYNRVRFAAENPGEVTEYVEGKASGHNMTDPLTGKQNEQPE